MHGPKARGRIHPVLAEGGFSREDWDAAAPR